MSVVRSMMLALVVVGRFEWVASAVAQQPVPVGPEFQVNTYTTDHQVVPSVATDAAGNFVVVWFSAGSTGTDTQGFSIQARRYDASGAPLGPEFQVNTYTTSHQLDPVVWADGTGNFVVVWVSDGSDGPDSDSPSIQAQRFDANGMALGGEFQVNAYTTSAQWSPSIATSSAGFVVTWQSDGSSGTDTGGYSIQLRRFDGSGVPEGSEFQVNTYTTGSQSLPSVASDAAGNFVIVWQSNGSPGTDVHQQSIQARRYDSAGVPQGPQFQVNTFTTYNQLEPDVAMGSAGAFLVVWRGFGSAGFGSPGSDNSADSVHARLYDAAGNAEGAEFQVNAFTTGRQFFGSVVANGNGDFLTVWSSDPGGAGNDNHELSVQAKLYDANGLPVGGEFQVNSYTTFNQYPWLSSAAATDNGFVIAWSSFGSAGTDNGEFTSVQAQQFGIPTTTSTSTSSSSSTSSTTLPTTDLLPGRIVIIKPGAFAKFVAKPFTDDTFALPAANPIADGGSLRISDTSATAGDDSYPLPLGTNWTGLGSPAGSRGYKYKGAGTPIDPCKIVLVRESLIKAVCKGPAIALTPPFTGDVGVVLSLGTTDRYCALFGGDETRNDATLTKRKDAPAPAACP